MELPMQLQLHASQGRFPASASGAERTELAQHVQELNVSSLLGLSAQDLTRRCRFTCLPKLTSMTAIRAESVAFWLLGLLNNSGGCSGLTSCTSNSGQTQPLILCAVYVIMIAGANDISSGAVGLVYFCAVFPALLVKLSAPYW